MAEPKYDIKVIRIPATASPNVRYALEQQRRGIEPTGEVVFPGVLTWEEYQWRRRNWDEERQCVGLEALFYEGKDVKLFPKEWLDLAEVIDAQRRGLYLSRRWMGVDPAEGGDKSAWTIIDRLGIIEQIAKKTPDTNVVFDDTIELIRQHKLDPGDVCFDRGGGKQHADRLRRAGFPVRTVGFGEGIALEPKRGLHQLSNRKEVLEERYAYTDRRTQMYFEFAGLLDPQINEDGFGIPASLHELRRQLSALPKWSDEEGRYFLPAKRRRPDQKPNAKPTIYDMIGCSPDESDSTVLAIHAMLHKPQPAKIQIAY